MIVVGENSWVTIEEADDVLFYNPLASTWRGLEDTAAEGSPSKELYLINAFFILLNLPGFTLLATLTDDNVKRAQSEFAAYLADNYTTFMDSASVESRGVAKFKLSKWEEDYGTNGSNGDITLPFMVKNYLSSYAVYNSTVNLEP